jgi:putative transposase
MIITKNELSAEDVRRMAERVLKAHLKIDIQGYSCDTTGVLNVLMKAAVEGVSIESACADMEDVASSNRIREQLHAVLDVSELRRHECEMNSGLAACIPDELPRQGREMALDFHDEPFYGQTPELRLYACRGAAKEGTTHFYRLASLYVMWRQVRVTLALTYVLPEDRPAYVLQRLLERMQHLHFKPGVLYLDKGFCEGACMAYLESTRIPAVIACPIRGKQGKGGTRALCTGRKSYCTAYTFTDGTTARLALVASLVPNETGKKRRKWLAFVLIHLDWSAKKTYQRYRRRFGIESAYRQFGRLRVRTTGRNPALRFFVLALGFLLLNIWVRLRWLATRLCQPGPARLDLNAFRLHRFIAFLRRAIEHAFGVPMAIPIYSW